MFSWRRPAVALAVGIGLAGCSSSTTPAKVTQQPSVATSVASGINVFGVLGVKPGRFRSHGFELAIGQANANTPVNAARAKRVAALYLGVPLTQYYPPFLVKYMAIARRLQPPRRRYITCWGLKFHGIASGAPIVAHSQTGFPWTFVLVNSRTGRVQYAFAGKTLPFLPQKQ